MRHSRIRPCPNSGDLMNMLNRHPRVLLIIIGCLSMTFGGCSKKSEQFEIRGQVTYQGQPIADGKILFMPIDESRPQAIAKIVDGEYVTASPGGVFVGEYKVQVFGYRGNGKIQDLGELYGGKQEQQVQYVPAKFNQETELTVDISSEESEYDFEL